MHGAEAEMAMMETGDMEEETDHAADQEVGDDNLFGNQSKSQTVSIILATNSIFHPDRGRHQSGLHCFFLSDDHRFGCN